MRETKPTVKQKEETECVLTLGQKWALSLFTPIYLNFLCWCLGHCFIRRFGELKYRFPCYSKLEN